MKYQEHFHLSHEEALATPADAVYRFFDMKQTEKEYQEWENQNTPQQ